MRFWRSGGRLLTCALAGLLIPTLLAADTAGDPDDGTRLAVVDRVLREAVARRAFPGGVLVVGRRSGGRHAIAFGRLTYDRASAPATGDTIYDLASLTKVVATTSMAMVLVDQGRLDLDAAVGQYLVPGTAADAAVSTARVRDLLTHSSGLPAWAALYRELRGTDGFVRRIAAMEPEYAVGAQSLYSDLGMILLGAIVERVSDQPLDQAAGRFVFEPLGMKDTGYRPAEGVRVRVAPTEDCRWRGRVLRGEVQDENAYAMGGVAGHAGLFGTATDLARFAQAMLREGELDGRRVIAAETVRRFTTRCGITGSSRALGWDTPGSDPYIGGLWSARSFGHTGLTGTFLWIDPEQDLFVVLLTNRVHPTRDNDAFREVRRQVANLVVQAMQARPVALPPTR